MAFTKDAFSYLNTFFSHREQRRPVCSLVAHAFFPAVCRASIPGPPVLVVTLSIERSFSSDRDVLLLERINERRVIQQFDTFPTREHDGQIVFRIPAELDRRAFLDLEIDVALQMNRAADVRARRNDNLATTGFHALIDRSAKGRGAIGSSIAFGLQMKRSFWKSRRFDALANRGHQQFPWTIRLRKREYTRRNGEDRKSTRLNSSHGYISYAVFCLKKKKKRSIYRNTDKMQMFRST